MLEQKISKDYIQAMKDKDKLKSSTLNFLRAQIKNILIDQKKDSLEDSEVIAVIKKQVKQRQDSIEQFTKGGREDLATKEAAELEILKSYLPAEMSEDEIGKHVQDAISESGATSMKDMGSVMKIISGKLMGRADNKLVSEVVKSKLASL